MSSIITDRVNIILSYLSKDTPKEIAYSTLLSVLQNESISIDELYAAARMSANVSFARKVLSDIIIDDIFSESDTVVMKRIREVRTKELKDSTEPAKPDESPGNSSAQASRSKKHKKANQSELDKRHLSVADAMYIFTNGADCSGNFSTEAADIVAFGSKNVLVPWTYPNHEYGWSFWQDTDPKYKSPVGWYRISKYSSYRHYLDHEGNWAHYLDYGDRYESTRRLEIISHRDMLYITRSGKFALSER